MTIGTLTLLALTGSLLLLKLGLMAFALALLANTLFAIRPHPVNRMLSSQLIKSAGKGKRATGY
jgi:hypothetical protein